MARKSEAVYTNYPLPESSSALSDLDAFCEEWGNISRADATQRLVIAWSKARRGDLYALGAMGITLSVTATVALPEPQGPAVAPVAESKLLPPRRTNGNAKAVELDL